MNLPNISSFKNALYWGGARANYYLVQGQLPDSAAEFDLKFLCRAASLPVANVNVVDVMTPGGRKIKLSGERTFDNWTITVYNDTNMVMRKAFEAWQARSGVYSSPIAYDALSNYASQAGWSVSQLNRKGGRVHGYNFYNCWPARLGEIALSYDEAGSIEEFEVELAFSHYIPTNEGSPFPEDIEYTDSSRMFGSISGGGIPDGLPTDGVEAITAQILNSKNGDGSLTT